MPFLFFAVPTQPYPPFFFSPNRLHKSCLCNDNSATLPAGEQKQGREGGGMKWAFLTRTWQMSSHGVWALTGSDELRRRVGVTKTERKKPKHFSILFKRVFPSLLFVSFLP